MSQADCAEIVALSEYSGWRSAPGSISCVVPAYNEAENLPRFLEDLHAVLLGLCASIEIVLVDDGSTDGTAAIAARLAPALGLRYLRLSRNFGKEAALSAGIDCARGEVVLLIDADGQHPLEAVPGMFEQWRKGFDVVYGVRRERGDEGILKRVGTRVLYRILAAGAPITIPAEAGDFRLLDRKVIDALKRLPERNRFMKGLYAWVGFDAVAVPFVVKERHHGASSFTLRRLSGLALDGITAFSNLPLRIWSGIGVLVSLFALVYGAWIVYDTLINGNDVPGWTTIAAGMLFFSGIQLISIGIIGEYLGRVFDEVKRRPIYIVRDELDCSALAHGRADAGPGSRAAGEERAAAQAERG